MQDQQLVEQAESGPQLLTLPSVRNAWADRNDLGVIEGMEFQIGQMVVGRDVLFPEEHPPVFGKCCIRCCGRWSTKSQRKCEKQISGEASSADFAVSDDDAEWLKAVALFG